MPGALVGVASCARCGSMQTAAGVLCQSCGTVLTPAARAASLGTYTPLLAGVARANAATRLSDGTDRRASPCGRSGGRRRGRPLPVHSRTGGLDYLVRAASFVARSALLFVRRGRTLGRLALRPADGGRPDRQPGGYSQDDGAFHRVALDPAYGDSRPGPGPRPADSGSAAASGIGAGRGHPMERCLRGIRSGCHCSADVGRGRDCLRHRPPPGDPRPPC